MNIGSLGLLTYEKELIEKYLKEFNKLPDDFSVNWLPINHPDITVAILRASFLGEDQIQKSLIDLPQRVSILALSNTNESIVIQDKHIEVIDLSESNEKQIQNWIAKIPFTISEIISENAKDNDFNTDGLKEITNVTDVNNLFKLLKEKQSGYILLESRLNSNNFIIVDSTESKAYLYGDLGQAGFEEDYSHCAIEHFLWKEYYNIPSDYNRKISKEEWAWETLWSSKLDFSTILDKQKSFKLQKWPHFCRGSRFGKTEALKLSALINREPLSIDDLTTTEIEYDSKTVSKFIYIMLSINFATAVAVNHQKDQEKIATSQAKISDNKNKKELLSGMRKLFGF